MSVNAVHPGSSTLGCSMGSPLNCSGCRQVGNTLVSVAAWLLHTVGKQKPGKVESGIYAQFSMILFKMEQFPLPLLFCFTKLHMAMDQKPGLLWIVISPYGQYHTLFIASSHDIRIHNYIMNKSSITCCFFDGFFHFMSQNWVTICLYPGLEGDT